MEDLLSIVVLILYFVIAGVSGKNKKKKKKAKQRANRSREAQFEQAFDLPGEGDDPCHEQMLPPQRESMRLEHAMQTQLQEAPEGEDPCHSGAADERFAPPADSPVYRSPIFDTGDKDAFAQDVLRGIVMSEVLARPASRRIGRGMKRGA